MNKVKISVRLTEKEHNFLKRQAEICGLKMEPYIRKLIMGKEILPRPPDEYYKILREINAIGNNINQIAYIANSQKQISAENINRAVKMVGDIMNIVTKL